MSQNTWSEIIISPRSMERLKPGEVKWPAQGHTASKGSEWDAYFWSGLPTWEGIRRNVLFFKTLQQA